MRLSVVAACLSLCLIGFATANEAHASIRKDTNIPAEGLGPALNALARDRNFQIVYVTEEIANLRTGGATGSFTTEEALKRLLIGTGLSYRYLDDKTVTILPVGSVSTQNERAAPMASDNQGGDVTDAKEGKKSSSGEFRVAQVDQGKSSGAVSIGNPTSNSQENSNGPSAGLAEIIVTAQKREERLQDVPIPVTAISAEALVQSNQSRLQDYYTDVPGLIVSPTPASGATQIVTIRGISPAGFGNPTVGITIDDVPYGSSTNLGGGLSIEDIDPGDLARVEVLRGPQGTLYGANSLGGLIKFVTVDPSTDRIGGNVQVGTSSVYNGAELGYNVRGSVNVPLTDTLAIRGSGFVRQDPGFIDNPVLGIDGINKVIADGGRLSALWRPSQDFSVKLSGLLQTIRGDGLNDVNEAVNGYVGPPLGDLQQNYLRGVGWYFKKVQAYSALVSAKLGNVDFTSITGYNVNSEEDSFDLTYATGACCTSKAYPGVTGSPLLNIQKTEKFAQELRASIPLGSHLDWLVGAFYTHENSPGSEIFQAENPATGVIVAQDGLYFAFPSTYQEYAAFTDLTVHITNQFNIQFGGRESQIRQTSSSANIGPLDIYINGLPSPTFFPQVDVNTNAFTYLVTPQFKFTPDLMVYARLASGYRTGGTNVTPGAPTEYRPDTTRNYELGVKGDFMEHRLSLDASVYYIDWRNIQISVQDPQNFVLYNTNAGSAKSQGIELSAESRPIAGLKVSGWVGWNDAKLTQDFPSSATVSGENGDRLPFTSRFSGKLSLEESFPVVDDVTGFVGASVSYLSDQEGAFVGEGTPRQVYRAYARSDARAGIKYDTWTVNAFVNNIANKLAIIGGGEGAYPPYAFNVLQPRTIGVSIAKTF